MSGEESPDGVAHESSDVADTGAGDEVGAGDTAAAAALNRAREAARASGLRPGAPGRARRQRASGSSQPRGDRGAVERDGTAIPGTGPGFPPGAGPDPRSIADTVSRVVTEQGWRAPISVGAVIGRWQEVVGAEVAAHATPETFVDGRLVVRASSTAWATQLQLLVPQLERRLEEEVGEGVVTELVIIGPGAPSWVRGLRVVRGRGPRDTYG